MFEFTEGKFDVVVIGAGHAGVEAAAASAKLNKKTAMLTLNLDSIAFMACNPSIGGTAKGHLVREIDALGGMMGKAADKTLLQMKMLNFAKGPAVRSLRSQGDKVAYPREMQRILKEEPNVELVEGMVEDLIVEDNTIKGVRTQNDEYLADKVVLAVGRDGAKWLSDVCTSNGIKMTNNQVDVGVRVETNDIIMEEINRTLYEGKFVYKSSVGTTVRTFCSNPSGHVVVENHSGIMLANGHAYHDPSLGSKNTNFALLVSHKFSDPFDKPNEYAYEVSRLANQLSMGSVIIQKYGDIKKGRRSSAKRISEGFVNPTLKEAVPGDLGLVLPYNTMISIIEMIEALDHVTPGIASDHTLFYGVEAKFYSARPEVNDKFETKINGLYVAGDGAGLTRGLAQAEANGVWVARDIIKQLSK